MSNVYLNIKKFCNIIFNKAPSSYHISACWTTFSFVAKLNTLYRKECFIHLLLPSRFNEVIEGFVGQRVLIEPTRSSCYYKPGQSLIYEWRLHQPKIPTRRRGLLTSVGRLCADLGHVSVLPSDLSYTKCVKLKIAAAAKHPKGPHRSCPQDVSIHLKFKTEA